MTEIWRAVPGHALEASSFGRVRKAPDGQIRVQSDNGKGYLTVSVGKAGRAKVHRLVAAAFYGESSALVRHLDGDKLNNRAENLAYGTVSENQLDSVAQGTHAKAAVTHCPQGHEYSAENTYRFTYKGSPRRQCKTCHKARHAARKKRREA